MMQDSRYGVSPMLVTTPRLPPHCPQVYWVRLHESLFGLDKTKLINYLSAPTYDLEDQIEHKIALLKKLVPRTTQLTLIGHSIGCKICMEIFKRNSSHTIRGLKSHRTCNETSYYLVLDVYFLFPTIENMVTTDRGRQVLPWVTSFRLLAVVTMCVLSLIPGDSLLSSPKPQSPKPKNPKPRGLGLTLKSHGPPHRLWLHPTHKKN